MKFTVYDNGLGFAERPTLQNGLSPKRQPPATGTGTGIANSRRRLELTYGSELLITSKPGTGTTVSYSISLDVELQEEATKLQSTPQAASAKPAYV